MSADSVDRRTRTRASYELELRLAVAEDEARQGRTMTPSERESFARGFFGPEYADEIRLLAASGHLDEEDGEEE